MIKQIVLIGSGIFALVTIATSISRYQNERKKTARMQKRLAAAETAYTVETLKKQIEEAKEKDGDWLRKDVERFNRQFERLIGE